MAQSNVTNELTQPLNAQDHVRGGADAPVTLVEYGDFECPFCGETYQVVRALERRFGDRFRHVFRHYPLPDVHPYAQRAAEASESAAAQGRFWEMHDYLFEHQPSLSVPDLLRYAADLDLDIERVSEELAERTHRERVLADLATGEQSGVEGTPTFFLNGRRVEQGWNRKSLTVMIEAMV
ncbi:MAG: thioredoxin domain-containing protein [Chloroflexia bacterium]|nr:thioredoxin domain-containing protein [Chloroflexia bacterium]